MSRCFCPVANQVRRFDCTLGGQREPDTHQVTDYDQTDNLDLGYGTGRFAEALAAHGALEQR